MIPLHPLFPPGMATPTPPLTALFLGMGAMASFFIAGFFFYFWRMTRDRFFALFALAFLILAGDRALLAVMGDTALHSLIYWVRLPAFVLIIVAIIMKNIPMRGKQTP